MNNYVKLPWEWPHGRPAEMLTDFQVNYFRDVIKEMKLRGFEVQVSVPAEYASGGVAYKSAMLNPVRFRKIELAGGIIGPHFHFEGKIYLLDNKQWQKFSTGVVSLFRERLEKAGTIDIEQFSKLNDALTQF